MFFFFLLQLIITTLTFAEVAPRCGSSWTDANSKCGTVCPSGTDSDCDGNEHCYRGLTQECTTYTTSSASASIEYRCGSDWSNANSKCGTTCPNGKDWECSNGEKCFAGLTMSCVTDPDTTLSPTGPRCGATWTDANSNCGTPCPSGTDAECSDGTRCFGGLNIACTTAAPTETVAPTEDVPSCIDQSLLICINEASSFWPKCDPSQTKSSSNPAGYEYGYHCTEDWTRAFNEMMSNPAVNKCYDRDAIHRTLAQIAHETAFFSTIYQPADGGAGLIHMIPQNWAINAGDMDAIWPGNNYEAEANNLGKSFFQNVENGWRSVAAWFLDTNRVIGGCGLNLFEQDYDTMTRCIFGQNMQRSVTYNIVGDCMATHYSEQLGYVPPTVSTGHVPPTEMPSQMHNGYVHPTDMPSQIHNGYVHPTEMPSTMHNGYVHPTERPSISPVEMPTTTPREMPTFPLSQMPSAKPSGEPTTSPITEMPSLSPSDTPSAKPSCAPTTSPTSGPSEMPSLSPSEMPSASPTSGPSEIPSLSPSEMPSAIPSEDPTTSPTTGPSEMPSNSPTMSPTTVPSEIPSARPSVEPTASPTVGPSEMPTFAPSTSPSVSSPTAMPTVAPSTSPSLEPSSSPSISPSTNQPTAKPSVAPTEAPSYAAVDCVMTEWVDGECDVTCGTGTRTQTRYVLVHPAYGGEQCPTITHQITSCNLIPCSVKGETIQLRIELKMKQGELTTRSQSVQDAILATLPSDVDYFNVEMKYEMIPSKLSRRFLLEMVDYVIDYTVVVSSVMEKDLVTNTIGEDGFLEYLEESFASYDLSAQISDTYALAEALVNGESVSSDMVWAGVMSILSILAFVLWRYGSFCPKKEEKEKETVMPEIVIHVDWENRTATTTTAGGKTIPVATTSIGEPDENETATNQGGTIVPAVTSDGEPDN